MALDKTNAIGGELGFGNVPVDATSVDVDTSDFDTPGTGANLQEILVELEARIAAVE